MVWAVNEQAVGSCQPTALKVCLVPAKLFAALLIWSAASLYRCGRTTCFSTFAGRTTALARCAACTGCITTGATADFGCQVRCAANFDTTTTTSAVTVYATTHACYTTVASGFAACTAATVHRGRFRLCIQQAQTQSCKQNRCDGKLRLHRVLRRALFLNRE